MFLPVVPKFVLVIICLISEVNNSAGSEIVFLFITSCNAVFLVFLIHTTFQSVIIDLSFLRIMIFSLTFNVELVYKRGGMRKIIICIFLVLTFICSCSEKDKTASDSLEKEKALRGGKQYTDSKKAIELQPNNAETYAKRGEDYYNRGQYKQAIEDFNKAIGLKQDYARAYTDRGASYYNLGQYKQAIEDFNKAIRVQPDFANAYSNRAIAYLSRGNKKLGCPDAQKACELKNCKELEVAKGKGLCS